MNREVNFLRFSAIFLMMLVHVPYLADYVRPGLESATSVFVIALQYGLGRISAPLIGLVSGYFCVAMLASRGPVGFVERKVQTLLVPLLFWTIADILILMLVWVATGGDYYRQIWSTTPAEAIGLFEQPVNYPLYYLADLFKCCLVFVGVSLAARALGLAGRSYAAMLVGCGVAVFLAITYVTVFLPESPFAAKETGLRLAFRPDLALFFFLGAALAAEGKTMADLFGFFRRRVGAAGVAGLLGLTVLLALLSVEVSTRLGDASVSSIALDVVKRFVGAGFLLALVAWLSERGLVASVTNRLSFRMFCTHVIFYQVFITSGFRPNTDLRAVVFLLAYPVAATALAWLSLELQVRIAGAMRPGRLRRVIEGIP